MNQDEQKSLIETLTTAMRDFFTRRERRSLSSGDPFSVPVSGASSHEAFLPPDRPS
jgi:hypothetical protein